MVHIWGRFDQWESRFWVRDIVQLLLCLCPTRLSAAWCHHFNIFSHWSTYGHITHYQHISLNLNFCPHIFKRFNKSFIKFLNKVSEICSSIRLLLFGKPGVEGTSHFLQLNTNLRTQTEHIFVIMVSFNLNLISNLLFCSIKMFLMCKTFVQFAWFIISIWFMFNFFAGFLKLNLGLTESLFQSTWSNLVWRF